MKALQEGLGAIRDVLLDGSQNTRNNLTYQVTLKIAGDE
jgi:hypothetical protein